MFNYVWYHGTIRRYIVLFGTIFNQIYITRTDADGETTSLVRVPITYGPADKVLQRVSQDPDLTRPFGSILPYMSFEILRLGYDGDRHLATQGREVKPSSNKDVASWVNNPVPYNFLFELNIIAKNAEDGLKIIEQILPFFTPTWTATVRIIDEPIIEKDISLTMASHDLYDTWDGKFEDRRHIRHILRFEMLGWLFGPIQQKKVIKKFEGNFSAEGSTVPNATVHVMPGLTANGEPTSILENSVDYSQISWEDDFGYIERITVGGEDV